MFWAAVRLLCEISSINRVPMHFLTDPYFTVGSLVLLMPICLFISASLIKGSDCITFCITLTIWFYSSMRPLCCEIIYWGKICTAAKSHFEVECTLLSYMKGNAWACSLHSAAAAYWAITFRQLKEKTLAFGLVYWQTKQWVMAAGQALQYTVGSHFRKQVTRSRVLFHKERQCM